MTELGGTGCGKGGQSGSHLVTSPARFHALECMGTGVVTQARRDVRPHGCMAMGCCALVARRCARARWARPKRERSNGHLSSPPSEWTSSRRSRRRRSRRSRRHSTGASAAAAQRARSCSRRRGHSEPRVAGLPRRLPCRANQHPPHSLRKSVACRSRRAMRARERSGQAAE